MAMFYTGYRPILQGQNANDWVNPYTGKVGNYSNWSIFTTHHPLDGAPKSNHTPGTGYHPHDLQLTRRFLGYDAEIARIKNAGSGARIAGMRYRPLENKSADGAKVFQLAFGHLTRVTNYSRYSNYIYDGLPAAEQLANVGHAERPIGTAGAPATYGEFFPAEFKGVNSSQIMPANFGQAVPATASTDPYGHNRVKEWRGVASAKALNV